MSNAFATRKQNIEDRISAEYNAQLNDQNCAAHSYTSDIEVAAQRNAEYIPQHMSSVSMEAYAFGIKLAKEATQRLMSKGYRL